MRVRLISFGPLRQFLPAGGAVRELPHGETVRAVLEAVRRENLLPEAALRSAAVAVNHEYVGLEHRLADGDEVAILPPVSGGTGDSLAQEDDPAAGDNGLIALVWDRIDAEEITARVKAGADGAVCVFDGIVRDNTRGRRTLFLEYEAYEEMALRQMRDLRLRAREQFGVREIAIIHRLGRLEVGESSVLIAVASAHRGAAFDACRWVIDTLKKTVPVWKREHFVDGAVWVDGEPFPDGVIGGGRG